MSHSATRSHSADRLLVDGTIFDVINQSSCLDKPIAYEKTARTNKPKQKTRKAISYAGFRYFPDCSGQRFGGETGIRTLGGIAATIDFESIPFGRSGISPWDDFLPKRGE